MQFLDLTLPQGAANVALDEALLDQADAAGARGEALETLRLWEAPRPVVVLGASSQTKRECDLGHCRADGVEIVRRTSGGAPIVAGPGCLMYAVTLSTLKDPRLRSIDHVHEVVLSRLIAGLQAWEPRVSRAGTSDLVVGVRKFSGNSLRCKRHAVLYHGTLLYSFDLPLVARYLTMPLRQPEYREARGHLEFIDNVAIDGATLRRAVREAFDAHERCATWPAAETETLVNTKFATAEWTNRL